LVDVTCRTFVHEMPFALALAKESGSG
jgi:hypothetical protein